MVIITLLSSGGIDPRVSFGAGGRYRLMPERIDVGGFAAIRRPEPGC